MHVAANIGVAAVDHGQINDQSSGVLCPPRPPSYRILPSMVKVSGQRTGTETPNHLVG